MHWGIELLAPVHERTGGLIELLAPVHECTGALGVVWCCAVWCDVAWRGAVWCSLVSEGLHTSTRLAHTIFCAPQLPKTPQPKSEDTTQHASAIVIQSWWRRLKVQRTTTAMAASPNLGTRIHPELPRFGATYSETRHVSLKKKHKRYANTLDMLFDNHDDKKNRRGPPAPPSPLSPRDALNKSVQMWTHASPKSPSKEHRAEHRKENWYDAAVQAGRREGGLDGYAWSRAP